MRVLMIAQSVYGDGIGTVASNLQASLSDQGYIVDIACFQDFSEEDAAVKEVRRRGGTVYNIPGLKKAGILGYMREIEKLCSNNHYDAVHIHTGLFSWISAKAAKKCGVMKRIAHAHGQMTNLPKTVEKIVIHPFRLLNRYYCTDLIGCTEKSNLFTFGVKGTVIPNYIRTKRITDVPEEEIRNVRSDFDKDNKKKLFGFMGTLT